MAVRTGEERRKDTIVTLGFIERTENGEAFKGVIRRRRSSECAGKKENENEWIMGIERKGDKRVEGSRTMGRERERERERERRETLRGGKGWTRRGKCNGGRERGREGTVA